MPILGGAATAMTPLRYSLSSAASSITVSGLSNYKAYLVVYDLIVDNTVAPINQLQLRLNGDSSANYFWQTVGGSSNASSSDTSFTISKHTATTAYRVSGSFVVTKSSLSQYHSTNVAGSSNLYTSGNTARSISVGGTLAQASDTAISSIQLIGDANFQAGSGLWVIPING